MNGSIEIAGILLLGVVACSCSRTQKPTEAPATRVRIEVVEATLQASGRNYSGTVEESSGTVLSFSAAGTIMQMNVSVGDYVTKGMLIATLDASNLRHAYDIAASTLNQAQDAYDRMKQLHEAKALPDIKWVEVQNALVQAKNAAAIARKGLADADLYAPVAGYISEKIADAGMNVAPGMPVVKLLDITPVKVSISIPENEISKIAANSSAQITVGAVGGKAFVGKLTEKGVAANPLSRSYDVKFEIPNPDGELLPGMICDVSVTADSVEKVIALPSDAVLLDADNRNFVWIATNGRAQKRIVNTNGMTSGTRIIVDSGLSVGDSVIVGGQQKVSQGTRVTDVSK